MVGFNSKGVIAISGANREITPDDRWRVEESRYGGEHAANREIVQFCQNYALDGQQNIKDPVGMQGIRLEVTRTLLRQPRQTYVTWTRRLLKHK